MAKLYRQIQAYLEEQIVRHRDQPGFKLPSEQALAIKFKASRVTVRTALGNLEERGLIVRMQGKGSFIREPSPGAPRTLAFLAPDAGSAYMRELIRGMTDFCSRNELDFAVLFSCLNPGLEDKAIRTARDLKCDGLMLMPLDFGSYSDEMLRLSLRKTPVVFVDWRLPGLDFPCVSSDHFDITYQAVRYLAQKGHRDIVFLVSPQPRASSLQSRLRGFEQGLLDFLGTINRHNFFTENLSHAQTVEYFTEFFREHPSVTGIICGSGQSADAVLAAFRRLGRTPGRDFGMVLIDNESAYTLDLLGLKLPTITQDGYGIGFTAARTLFDRLTGKEVPAETFIPTRFETE